MTLDWTSSTDQLLRATSLPAWALLAVAGLLGLVLFVTLLRTERSVANGLLAALTLAALALALASQLRTASPERSLERVSGLALGSSVPALACIDDMAGETALAACEKVLFGAPEIVAAAVLYASSQLHRLTAIGDASAANREMTPQLFALRRAIERDRYGLFAYVLASRDNCQPEQCAAYAAMTDHNQVAANMNDLIYEGLVSRYAPSWNATATTLPTAQAALTTGKPTSFDFPSAASIPPVTIMSAEPSSAPATATVPSAPTSNVPATETPITEQDAAKKPAARQRSPTTTSSVAKQKRQQSSQRQFQSREPDGPVQLTPGDR